MATQSYNISGRILSNYGHNFLFCSISPIQADAGEIKGSLTKILNINFAMSLRGFFLQTFRIMKPIRQTKET